MPRLVVVLLALLFLVLVTVPAAAQRSSQELPDPAKDYQWREEAGRHGLSPACVELLARQKVLVTGESFKQVFDPYIRGGLPLFITSDSLLNAFHVLYEESVLRLETANARRLPLLLRHLWDHLDEAAAEFKEPPELMEAAKRRARVIVGTALRLLENEAAEMKPGVAALVAEEVAKVQAAKVTEKPAWLGPPDPGFLALDYSRFRPRGFYTKSEDLERYFRAVAWLQAIPFRVSKDEELLSVLILAFANVKKGPHENVADLSERLAFFRCFREFVGTGDDWDLLEAQSFSTTRPLADYRKHYVKETPAGQEAPQINDLVRFAPTNPAEVAEPNFRILSAYRTPDAVLFHRTTDIRTFGFDRTLPSGLDVATALGSSYARSKVTFKDREKLLRTIDEAKVLFKGSSLYFGYLDCLAALLDEPEPDAPDFMRAEPWQAKSCQTVLGAWAQLRHTWALQAKQSVTYLCMSILPPGFVEPEPEFFSRMARLAERTSDCLEEAGALRLDGATVAEEFRDLAGWLEREGFDKKGFDAFKELGDGPDVPSRLEKAMLFLGALGHGARFGIDDSAGYYAEGIRRLRQAAAEAQEHGVPENARLRQALAEAGLDIESRWRRFHDLCRGLENLAHKQLRGVPLSKEDGRFIMGYGVQIAGIMFYGGNSYVNPRDDAPRIVDVHSDPNSQRVLEVGIGRPRALYVLYPYKDGEVLCRGAVMPYYEFPSATRLTDAEWKGLLDSEAAPELPEWVKPIIGPGMARPTAPAEE